MNKRDNILITFSDLLINPFYFNFTKDFRRKVILEALKFNFNLVDLAKKIGCCEKTLENFSNDNEHFTKAGIVQKLLNITCISYDEAQKNLISVKRGCGNTPVKIKLPIRVSPDLSLLIAKSIGDGSILSDYRFFYCNSNKKLIDEVLFALENVFNYNDFKVYFKKSNRTYEFKSPSVIGYILNFLGAPYSYKVLCSFEIPDWIKFSNLEVKSAFLRGIFDDEACFDFRNVKKQKRIIFAMSKSKPLILSHLLFLKQIQTLLLDFEIQSSQIRLHDDYGDSVSFSFCIYRKENLKRFAEMIRSTHNDKRLKLKLMINSYVDKYVTRNKILNLLKSSSNGFTIKEISFRTEINIPSIKYHLYNLSRENLILKQSKVYSLIKSQRRLFEF